MAEEPTGQEVIDNQADLTDKGESTTEQEATATEEPKPEETIEETKKPEKPEFKDENMQSRFTERMTELAEREKKLDARDSEGEVRNKQAEAFKVLSRMPKFRDFYEKELRGEEQAKPLEITDEEYSQAQLDAGKMKDLIAKVASHQAENMVVPRIQVLEEELRVSKQAQDIEDFANAKDEQGQNPHSDFWDLDKQGKIEPFLELLQPLDVPGVQKVEMAYILAKYPTVKQEALIEAHKRAEEKKGASTDKGLSTETVVTKPTKKMNTRDFYYQKIKELDLREKP